MNTELFVSEKRAREEAKALLDVTDEAMHDLITEYLWYRFLREVVGIVLLAPEEIEAASLLQPQGASNEVRDKYEAGFRLWFAGIDGSTEYEAAAKRWHESLRDDPYDFEPLAGYITNDARALDIDLYILYGKPYDKEKYCVSIQLAEHLSDLYNLGAFNDVVTLVEFEGKNVTEACDWIRTQMPAMAKYARKGYAPVASLPSAGTLKAEGWFNQMVTPYQPEQSKMHWLRDYPERAAWIDDDDDEVEDDEVDTSTVECELPEANGEGTIYLTTAVYGHIDQETCQYLLGFKWYYHEPTDDAIAYLDMPDGTQSVSLDMMVWFVTDLKQQWDSDDSFPIPLYEHKGVYHADHAGEAIKRLFAGDDSLLRTWPEVTKADFERYARRREQ
jgi:hypothetical protein